MAGIVARLRDVSAVSVVEVRDFSVVRGGRPVLSVEHLAVAEGETLTIVGPNGAGKTTLLLALAGLVRPDKGQLLFRGTTVGRSEGLAYRRRLGLVLPDPLLLDASVFANVALGLRFRGVSSDRIEPLVSGWLERLGVAHLRDRHARRLSSGEAQRVSLARALVLAPDLLLLDEPFASVDAATRAQLVEDLAVLLEATPVTCALVTHDLDEAVRLGDHMAVLLDGRLRQAGSPEAVLASPIDEDVAAFVGVETRVRGMVTAVKDGVAVVDTGTCLVEATLPEDGATTIAPARPVLCCLRPGDVTVWSAGSLGASSSARNRLDGRIARLAPQGSTVRVTIDCSFPLVALITRASADEMALAEGQQVTAVFKAGAVHLIPLAS
jgi:tungstate transport system ATP-binding protein